MPTTPNYGWPYPASSDHTRTWEYWQNLATGIDTTLKAQIKGPIQSWSPVFTGFTLGNGVLVNANYRAVGGLCWLHVRINAAASAPTTAFTGAMQITNLPLPWTGIGSGLAWFYTAGVSKLGQLIASTSGTAIADVCAIKQSDLSIATVGSVWGTSPWAVGSNLQMSMTYPI